MKSLFLAPAIVLSALFCTIAGAAPAPELKIATDRMDKAAVVLPGAPIDLLVRVDPKGAPVPLEGLRLAVDAAGAATFAAPVLPPPDGDGAYTAPFTIRVPMTLGGGGFDPNGGLPGGGGGSGPFQVTATLTGDGWSADGTGKVFPDSGAKQNHITGTARLKAPAVAGVPNAVVLDLSLVAPYHVYGAKAEDTDGLKIEAELLPAGPERLWTGGGPATPPEKKYTGDFTVEIPFTPATAGRVETRVALFWQACTDQICDPNEMAYLPVAFDVAEGDPGAVIAQAVPPDEDDLANKGYLALILLSIGAGLFALAMPCTYPMIPITISFFSKQAEARGGKVLPLALAYGFGIIAIFVVIGLLVGGATVTASSVLDFANNPWVNGLFALLFLVFGLSLIGLFEIRLPGWFDNVAAKAGGGGGYFSVFAMGATLVITSFTCTAPFIGSLLVWAAASEQIAKPAVSMGVFGLTMAIPFVFLALSPTAIQRMPKSGVWMKHLKVTLGIVELGLVLKFLSNVDLAVESYLVDREPFLWLWGASFLFAGLYLLGAFALLREKQTVLTRGRAAVAIGLLALTGYLWYGTSGEYLEKHLEAFLPKVPEHARTERSERREYHEAFRAVVIDDYEAGLKKAQELGAPVFLHFTGFQ